MGGNNSRQRLAKTTLEKQSVLAEEESGLAIGVKKQGRGEREPNPKWRTSVTQFEKLRVTDEEPLLFIWREMTLSLGLAAERIRRLCAFLVALVSGLDRLEEGIGTLHKPTRHFTTNG